MFRKRSLLKRSGLQYTDNYLDHEESENESSTTVMEIKMEQKLRIKKLGLEVSSEMEAESEKFIGRKQKSSVQKSIESTLGSQFESRVEDGSSSSGFNHEKIMEKYINEKMGIIDTCDQPQKAERSLDEDLYRISDEIKIVNALTASSGTGSAVEDSSSGDQFMSLGIAEVALPISFKLSNIEATEMSRKKVESERHAKSEDRKIRGVSVQPSSGTADIAATGTTRFWNSSMSSFVQHQEKDKAKATEVRNVANGPSLPETTGSNFMSESAVSSVGSVAGADGKRRMFSNDDQIMKRFRNHENNRK